MLLFRNIVAFVAFVVFVACYISRVGPTAALFKFARGLFSMKNSIWGGVSVLTWQLFAAGGVWSTTLPELIQASLMSHPSIRVQDAWGWAAEGGVSAARWQYFPTPSVAAERVARSMQSPSYRFGDSSEMTVRLQQPLWTGGRLAVGVEKAETAVVAARAGVEVARQELALRIVQAYAEWYGGVLGESAYEKSLQAHLRLQRQSIRRIKEGVSPQTDLLLVQGRIEQTRGELIVARAGQFASLSRLSQMLGRPVVADELMRSLAQPLEIGVAQEVVELAQGSSPGVARMVAAARMQQLEIDERRADLSPEVYLRMERQYGNFSFRGAPPENRIFLGMSTRFGAGLSVVSAIDAALGRHEAALADIEATRITLGDQVYADHVRAESGGRRLIALNASLSSAVATAQAWDRQFLSGQKSWLDVMNSVREVAQVEVQIADVNAAQLLLTWRLALYAGGVDALLVHAISPPLLIEKRVVSAVPDTGLILRFESALRWLPGALKIAASPAW